MPLRLFAQLVGDAGELGLFVVRMDVFPLTLTASDFVLPRIHVVVFAHARSCFKDAATRGAARACKPVY